MPDAMLVLQPLGLAGQVRLERVLQRHGIVGMHPGQPLVRPPIAGSGRQADQRAPWAGVEALVGLQVPLPQALARHLRGQRQPIVAADGAILPGAIREVVPQQRRAIVHGHHADLEDARARGDRHRHAGHVTG